MPFVDSALPNDLEALTLAKFDALLEKGEICYKPPRIDIVHADRFQVPKKPRVPFDFR